MGHKLVVMAIVLALAGTAMGEKGLKNTRPEKSQSSDVSKGHSPFRAPNFGVKQNLGDSIWGFDAQTPTGDNQILGLEFDGAFFWLTGGNSSNDPNKLYKFDAQGNLVATYDQPSAATGWGLRDLAWDGQYLYGSYGSTVYQIDPSNGNVVGTFTGPENPNRALAYDPATDHFWTANFSSNIYEFDRNGNVISSFTNTYSIYGMAWDDVSPDGPWLWVAAQEDNGQGGYNYIYQFDPRTGGYTGIGFPVTYSSPDGYAGGLAFTSDWDNSMGMLFEVIQGNPDAVIGMFVTEAGDSLDPRPPSNLTAYSDYTTPNTITLSWNDPTHYIGGDTLTDFTIEIWRSPGTKDTALIATVPAGTETYQDNNVTDGTYYNYFVRAVDSNDSASAFARVGWYAGGSPYPAPPDNPVANVIDESTVEVSWINPTTQSDGTPLDDLAGIHIYVDGSIAVDFPTTSPGMPYTDTITVTPGSHTIYLTAYDNETPVHESEPTPPINVVTNVHSGGPDGFGYTFMDSDYPGGPAFDWVDITNVGTPLNLGDDANAQVTMPMSFMFYGAPFNPMYVVSNGFLTLQNTTEFSNDSLPTDSPVDLIAPFWDDLNPSSGGNVYYYADTANGRFIVEWYQVPHYGSGGPYTFEVILYHSGDIVFQYLDMGSRIDESTVGIQAQSGAGNYYLLYSYNGSPVTIHDSLAIVFHYPIDVSETPIKPVRTGIIGTTINPGGTSLVSFAVAKNSKVALTLYDLSGRKVRDLFNGFAAKGVHRVAVKGLSSGVYFVKMESGNFRDVSKLVILK